MDNLFNSHSRTVTQTFTAALYFDYVLQLNYRLRFLMEIRVSVKFLQFMVYSVYTENIVLHPDLFIVDVVHHSKLAL